MQRDILHPAAGCRLLSEVRVMYSLACPPYVTTIYMPACRTKCIRMQVACMPRFFLRYFCGRAASLHPKQHSFVVMTNAGMAWR